MRRSVYLIFINAMILVVVMALMAQSLFIVKRLAKVESLQGHAWVQRGGNGEFTPLTQSDFIKTTDVISTKKDGEVELKWADGTRLKMAPNSNLTVAQASYNMARKAETSRFQLSSGTIYVRIMKTLSSQSKFEIETPTAKAAVRGTIFMVKVEKGQTEVAVHKGAVRLTSGEGEGQKTRLVMPQTLALSPDSGQIQIERDAIRQEEIETQFDQQPSIIKPELSARIRQMGDSNRALIQGRSEAGDKITINGQPVSVLGNGAFLYRATLKKGLNHFTIICTDKHGTTCQITKSLSVS
ncbi:MAG TPA: FecR domain-containing protein [Abditibacteriaceae bacterium]|jgi:hypothetical protein